MKTAPILELFPREYNHFSWSDPRSRPRSTVYLSETAENLVHGLCQSFEKRGLPRALMSDNGAAMIAAETVQGLERLGIVHERTLPYSAYQNGKQEVFWAQVEGRLLAMVENCKDLTLAQLNEAALAWIELEYNRKVDSEIAQSPLARYLAAQDVGRPCPQSDQLRQAFTAQLSRTQRQSDGTLSVQGIRFELPSRYRHLQRVTVRFASWDLSHAPAEMRETELADLLIKGIQQRVLSAEFVKRLKEAM